MAQSNIRTRDFREEDLPRVLELYKQGQNENPRFARNEALLRHFMSNLNASKGIALVTELNGGITGFAAVSVAVEQGGLRQGSIVELQVADLLSMRALIQAASDYCRLNDVDSIVVVPPTLPGANAVLKGWLKFDTGVMMARVLAPAPLLRALLSSERTRSLYAGRKIAFHIGADVINIEITPTEVHIFQPRGKRDKEVAQVLMSPEVFLKLVLGRLNPYTAYLNRKVKVKGVKNTLSLLKLLYLIRMDATFFTSLADRM